MKQMIGLKKSSRCHNSSGRNELQRRALYLLQKTRLRQPFNMQTVAHADSCPCRQLPMLEFQRLEHYEQQCDRSVAMMKRSNLVFSVPINTPCKSRFYAVYFVQAVTGRRKLINNNIILTFVIS